MTSLQQRALARLPLTVEQVAMWHDRRHMPAMMIGAIEELAESHERLRADCQGLEALRAEDEKRIARLVEFARTMAACTPDDDMAYAPVMAEKALRESGVDLGRM